MKICKTIILLFFQIIIFVCGAFAEKQMDCSIQKSIARHKFPTNVTAQAFIKSWPDMWLSKNELGLFEYRFPLINRVPDRKSRIGDVYIMPCKIPNFILLEIPTSKPDGETGDMSKCINNISMLKLSGQKEFLELNLNPYCNDSYEMLDVEFRFYWLTADSKPMVEIIVNGPACISVELYVFNTEKGKYKLAGRKCSV